MATKKAVKVEQVLDDKTASVARALAEGVLADRARFRETYAAVQNDLRTTGPRETEDGVSFFDDDLDTDALDAIVAGMTG